MYHVCKQIDSYDGKPYCGYTTNNVPAQEEVLEDAIRLAMRLDKETPVGWNVYNAETGKLVFGVEYFKEGDL